MSKQDNRLSFSRWWAYGVLLISLAFLTLAAVVPDKVWSLSVEDGALEWLQVALFLSAGMVWIVPLLSKNGRDAMAKRNKLFHLLLALFCFFIMMEEISWGQRILGFGTPTGLQSANYQNETTLHNLEMMGSDVYSYVIFLGSFLILGVMVPMFSRIWPAVGAWFDRLGHPRLPLLLVPLFLMGFSFVDPFEMVYIRASLVVMVLLLSAVILIHMRSECNLDLKGTIPFLFAPIVAILVVLINSVGSVKGNLSHNVAYEFRELIFAISLLAYASDSLLRAKIIGIRTTDHSNDGPLLLISEGTAPAESELK